MRDQYIRHNGYGRQGLARHRTLSAVLAVTAASALLFGTTQAVVADEETTGVVATRSADSATPSAGESAAVSPADGGANAGIPGNPVVETPLEAMSEEEAALVELTVEPEGEYHGATSPEEASLEDGESGAVGPFRTAPKDHRPRTRSIPRCGLRTAIVFDISNSIGPRGLEASKEAGKTVVDILSGTSTTLSVLNFATESPADHDSEIMNAEMAKPQDVDRAKRALDQLSLPQDRLGGTNWSHALQRLNDAAARGEKYDVIYFITDGKPTAPVGTGVVTNDSDIIQAQRQANALISKGSHIVGVGVGFKRNHDDRVVVHPDPRYGDALHRAAEESTSPYRRPGSEAARVRIPGVTSETHNHGRQYKQSVVLVTSQLKLLETISLERIILPNGFDHLRDELKRSFSGCSAKVVIKKEIVDANGTVLHNGSDIATPGVSPAGFEFRSQLYRIQGGRVEKTEGQKVLTDDRGVATLTVPTVVGTDGLEPGTVEVSENLATKPGWEQLLVDGNARRTAVCVAKNGNGAAKPVVGLRAPAQPDPNTIYVENSRDTKGFIVRNVQHFDTVECTVKNILPQAEFELAKQKISEPIALTGEKDQRLTAQYRVSVRNRSSYEATPSDLIEAPQNFPGMSIVDVRASGDLITEQNLPLVREGSAWLVPGAKMQAIRGNAERTMTVSVTYQVTDPAAATAKEQQLQCRTDSHTAGMGLVNRVVLKKDKTNRDAWKLACVDLQPPAEGQFELTKKAVHSPVVVSGSGNQEFSAIYEVAVKNNSSFGAVPREIIETPKALPGMSVVGVTVAGELAVNPAGLRKGANGAWSIGKADLKKIEPKRTATMRVEVRYRVTNPRDTLAASDRHECVAGQGDKGLVNEVKMAASSRKGGQGEQSAHACVSVAVPTLTVEKEVYTHKAPTKEQAYPLAPTAKEVQFTYRFGTGKHPLDVINLNDVVVNPNTGQHTNNFIDISGLRCSGAVFTPGRRGSMGDDGPRLTVDRNHRGPIVCQVTVTDPNAIPTAGNYTHTKVIAHGRFALPDYQKTPPAQSSPLTGEASAWIFTFPAMVGELPRSGGPGTGWYTALGGALVLIAGVVTWRGINRQKKYS